MHWLDPKFLVTSFGLLGVVVIVFAESGLFVGFFLPGDSLLFTAGLFASQGYFNISILILGCFIAAVVGDGVGYAFGRQVGPRLFSEPKSRFFNPQHIINAQNFYKEQGSKAIILARFMPVIRTFAPIVAGIGTMRYRTFFIYNVVGALLWTVGMAGLGYWLGATVPNIDHYVLPIVLAIIVISILPGFIHWYRKH